MKKTIPISSLNHASQSDYPLAKHSTKIEECLILLLKRHETNTHDAGRAYNETCLHSEVSSLQKDQGIMVDRVRKQIPSARSRAAYAHYFLTGDNRIKAMKLVDKLRAKRNTEPMIWEALHSLEAQADYSLAQRGKQ
jgi:hypothetical protein